MRCKLCGAEGVSKTLGVCVNCVRNKPKGAIPMVVKAHESIRSHYQLPPKPPKTKDGVTCNICMNECSIGDGEISYCGLKKNENGRLKSMASANKALMHYYYDSLPTNCCASWFCPGSKEFGKFNLAVFFYGCSFDCVFCQNASHKDIERAGHVNIESFVSEVVENQDISCVCYFGGSPEPQLPFALKASEEILKKRNVRICWEWNGSGNPTLVKKAAQLSQKSNGIVKFDLKACDRNLSIALSGVPNDRTYENFRMVAEEFYQKRSTPMLTATTLLVSNYVDKREVEGIAEFISDINPTIPYSLLVFHPDFYMMDLPITPKKQVEECYEAAKKHLKNVNIGNKHLLNFFKEDFSTRKNIG